MLDSHIRELVKAGADVNAQSGDGSTAFCDEIDTFCGRERMIMLSLSPSLNILSTFNKSLLLMEEYKVYFSCGFPLSAFFYSFAAA